MVWVLKSRKMRVTWHMARMRKGRGVYRVLEEKPEGKRPHGRPSRRWEGNIKIDLKEIVCEGVDWIDVAQDTCKWPALGKPLRRLGSV
jgi:hypothetical protein